MEIRIILRGALSGLVAGILGFIFAKVFAEPLISKAIDYEYGRGAVLDALNKAAHRTVAPAEAEIFSRDIQSTVGVASGIVAFSVAMGALVAVAYLVLHGRFALRPSRLAWMIAGFGFLGVYLLPFVKYPANPPAIGHAFTVTTRGQLYLAMVGCSLVLLSLAAYLARQLAPRIGVLSATLVAGVAFLAAYGVLAGLLPSLGDLAANVAASDQFGYARAATETPQPITNILPVPLVIDGKPIGPGQILYPGFDADLLWKFRWYSVINQLLVWTTIALAFGALLDRFILGRVPEPSPGETPAEPAAAAPGQP
jgi:predicted cobalt transporter CbtA